MRIILTRTREQCEPWRERLATNGHSVLVLPLIRYELSDEQTDLDSRLFDWILFTSPQGVHAFVEQGLADGLHEAKVQVAGLGAGTTAAMADHGLEDALNLNGRDGNEFALAFTSRVAAPAVLLLPGPKRRMAEPVAILNGAGFDVKLLTLYSTEPVPPAKLPEEAFAADDLVFFASPSAVRAFAAAYPDCKPRCAAIGETTARAAFKLGFEPKVAREPSLEGLCRAAGIAFNGGKHA